MNQKKREVIAVFHNHIDPQWARCFDRPAYNGFFLTPSYMDIFSWLTEAFMELADDGFCFSEGQVYFWETYLKRHPEREAEIKKLLKEGKLEFLMQGLLVCDTNYAPAEGIIRNFLLAEPFYQRMAGKEHSRQGFVWDAFGSSANLPQILKLCGANRVGGTKYRPCLHDVWVGIDGTALPCIDWQLGSCNLAHAPILYECARHPHCPACNGYGCEECNGRGMLNIHPFQKEEVLEILRMSADYGEEKRFVLIGGEETVPDACILEAMRELNQSYQGEVSFRFGTFDEFWDYHHSKYEAALKQAVQPTEDLNPVNLGGYLTRIENKQRSREVCYALIQAEAAAARRFWNESESFINPGELEHAWKNLILNIHHDSIAGAHIDCGQNELMDLLDESERIAYCYDYRKAPVKKPSGVIREKEFRAVKQLGKLRVTYDRKGILSIIKDGKDLFGTFLHRMGAPRFCEEEVRIGELMLQNDIGDFYGTYMLEDSICLGKFHYAVQEDDNAILWYGERNVHEYAASKLKWQVLVTPSADGERLDFTVDVDWNTSNKRLSVLIPVNDYNSCEAVWEIPYGYLKREFDPAVDQSEAIRPYHVPSRYETTAIKPSGDYPALHWVRHDIDETCGVAVLNRGLPCNKWEPGCFTLGLMRSPSLQGVTVMPHADEMWDIDDAREAGKHRFEFSVLPYTSPMSFHELTKLGYEYNRAGLELPFSVTGNAVITAFKVAESGDGVILRLYESEGQTSPVSVDFGEECSVMVVSPLEEMIDEAITASNYQAVLHKHEILTLKIWKEDTECRSIQN